MKSAAECLAKAAELALRATTIDDAELRADALLMADRWLDLSWVAERQDAVRTLLRPMGR